ncbi:hypothetical protein DFQ28_003306 [Apophysomyces sp. BC1034]|nr:hypothetical protein DFQ30_007753 [Apophysomyces sp. BC1015]KAG0178097.1 hypothetical protein DFQ29_003942 [Apophysomyces sp. BC1021]KAG0189528.1 hypothetical protein DFQ28_003306 [Apophysomyces sp. BC1034]
MDPFVLVASSIAALISRFITHPIDTIKTRLQVANHQAEGYAPFDLNHKATFGGNLYSGLSITLLLSVPAVSVYLSCYEFSKDWLDEQLEIGQNTVLNHLVSGCVAEVMAGLLFTPAEVIKNCLQVSADEDSTCSSIAYRIWQREGLSGFYKGYWLSLAVFVPHSMTYFVVYEQLKLWMASSNFGVYMICSIIASALAITLSTPPDIVKTRWQVSHNNEQVTVRSIVYQMYRDRGWRAFTTGLVARILWGIPLQAISMTVFEVLLDWHAGRV